MDVAERGILIVDDDSGFQTQLKWHFSQSNYSVRGASDRESAVDMVRRFLPPVVIQDLRLPPHEDSPSEGFQTMRAIREISGATQVVVITGMDGDHGVQAVSMGAYDFLSKPVDIGKLNHVVDRAFNMWELEQRSHESEFSALSNVHGFITANARMLGVCSKAGRLAATDVTCLVRGESGSGKEVLARAIHAMSPRREGPFVAINCAAIPESLIESELFGHEKGAFTGADARQIGRVEAAQGGTLFLDEIGDMPLGAQAKVLRFMQEKTVERVGGRTEIPVDVRIICATNRDLRELISVGSFRDDLYYRTAEVELTLPPLRERGEDKIVLAQYFLESLSLELNRPRSHFDEGALAAIDGYSWPGNVRELISTIRRGLVMAEGKIVTAEDLGLANPPSLLLTLRDVREAAERAALIKSLAASGGKIATAARLLGVTRPTFYSLLKRYSIASEDVKLDAPA